MQGKLKLTKEDKEWAQKIKDRDGNSCIVCGDKEKLNAHHLIPIQIEHMRHKLINGVTLCPLHHRFSRKLSAHQNPIAFQMWMEEYRREQINHVKLEVRQMADRF